MNPKTLILLGTTLVLATTQCLAASTGAPFSYQGRLSDAQGNPLTGSYDFTFDLYDEFGLPVGDSLVHEGVPVSQGRFAVLLDFGPGTFAGQMSSPAPANKWIEAGPGEWLAIQVRTNGAATWTTLEPQQQLLPTPYAYQLKDVLAGTAFAGEYSNPVNLSNPGNQFRGSFIGDGSGLTGLSGTNGASGPIQDDQLSDNIALRRGGNTFIEDQIFLQGSLGVGTSGPAERLHVVGNARVEGSGSGSSNPALSVANIDPYGIGLACTVTSSFTSLVVENRGSGDLFRARSSLTGSDLVFQVMNQGELCAGPNHEMSGDNAVIAGGLENVANGAQASIGGGFQCRALANFATIGGGRNNATEALYGTISGGSGNTANGSYATVGGGGQNDASAQHATVPGGEGNQALGRASLAAGRFATATHDYSFVWSSQTSGATSTADRSFDVYASGGAYFHTGGSQLWSEGEMSCQSLEIRGGADLAEPFAMTDPAIRPGAVVVIDEDHPGQLKLSTEAYDSKVAGIVSGAGGVKPGISMTQSDRLAGGKNVALSGRVYALVDASTAPVKPGDLLTTSATPGHAMKVTEPAQAPGAILGKAMSRLETGRGLVLVLVSLQ